MKIWFLTQDEASGYDTYDSCVVAAETEEDARNIHPSSHNGWEYKGRYPVWATTPENVKAVAIGDAYDTVEVGVILASRVMNET